MLYKCVATIDMFVTMLEREKNGHGKGEFIVSTWITSLCPRGQYSLSLYLSYPLYTNTLPVHVPAVRRLYVHGPQSL